MLLLANLCFVSSIAAASIPIHMDLSRHVRFPVAFIPSAGGENIPGFVDLGQNSPVVTRQNMRPTMRVRVSGFIATESPDFLEVHFEANDGLTLDLEYQRPVMYLPIGPRSPVMNPNPVTRPRGFLLSPISATQADFVMNPENPLEYALGGEIFYAPRNPYNQAFWIVPAAVRLVNNESDQSVPPNESDFTFCGVFDRALQLINPTRMVQYPTVPDRIFQQVLSGLSAIGVTFNQNGQRLINFEESLYDDLPSIQYIMETDDHQLMSLAVIEPREYIEETSTGLYELRLRNSNPTNLDCTLTRTILGKLVIHFDIANRRIGFGEPLIEL